ncbi:MAG: hypothetical protein ACP5KA_01980 [Desulfurococcaceae archaeon]
MLGSALFIAPFTYDTYVALARDPVSIAVESEAIILVKGLLTKKRVAIEPDVAYAVKLEGFSARRSPFLRAALM